jgi:hypothetical protein
MKSNVKKSIIAFFTLIGVLMSWVTFADALDVKLLWKKEFMNFRIGIGFAPGSGDLLIKKANKDNIGKEVILYDRGAMNDSTGDRGWIEESGVSIFQKMGNISLLIQDIRKNMPKR